VLAVPDWPPPGDAYLHLLRMYDLRPSQLEALRRPPSPPPSTSPLGERTVPSTPHGPTSLAVPQPTAEQDNVLVLHVVDSETVRKTAWAYAEDVDIEKHHIEKALRSPAAHAALLLVVPPGSRPPHPDTRAILLYTRTRRGAVHVVHTRAEWRGHGFASRLANAVKREVLHDGSLTIDSPWCTARSAVKLWLGAGFVCDQEILTCQFTDAAAFAASGNSVRLTFTWHKRIDGCSHIDFLRLVMQKHPELAITCAAVHARLCMNTIGCGQSETTHHS
jgi:GNAT superfamily N-acetyltransferase